MPVHVIPRHELERFVETHEAHGVEIVSVSPEFAAPGSMIVITRPVDERGVAEIEVRA